jgi:hypothetical protein
MEALSNKQVSGYLEGLNIAISLFILAYPVLFEEAR